MHIAIIKTERADFVKINICVILLGHCCLYFPKQNETMLFHTFNMAISGRGGSGSLMDALPTSSQGAVAGPSCASVAQRVFHGQSTCPVLVSPSSVNMSRCLSLARFALGSSQRVNPRLMSCARGLSCRTFSPTITGGKLLAS